MRVCSECSKTFSHTHALQRYCSDSCRHKGQWRRRSKSSCTECGKPCGYATAVKTEHMCQECRVARHPVATPFEWTCGGCGVQCTRSPTRGQKPKWCSTCRKALQNRDIKISPEDRVSIYFRDGWVCWLCEEGVDRSLIGTRSHWRPSLDHVLPRSKGGADDMENLKLAHWWCNAALSDGRSYSPEDFRVSA